MLSPYLVVKDVNANLFEDALDAKWDQGYRVFEVLATGGTYTVVFVMRSSVAADRNVTLPSGSRDFSDYEAYRVAVVEALVTRFGDHTRTFWERRHIFKIHYGLRKTPAEVIELMREEYAL